VLGNHYTKFFLNSTGRGFGLKDRGVCILAQNLLVI
jgi:hypothetical protein